MMTLSYRPSHILVARVRSLYGSNCRESFFDISLVCGIVLIHSLWNGATPEFLRHIATAAWALGMATQGYSTSVIAWQIWNIGVANSKAGNNQSAIAHYKAIIAIVVESGAIYTALVLPLTVTYAIGSSASIVIIGCLDPIAVSTSRTIISTHQ